MFCLSRIFSAGPGSDVYSRFSGVLFDPSLVPVFIQLLEEDQDDNLNNLPGNA
jgi:hypothetical protein